MYRHVVPAAEPLLALVSSSDQEEDVTHDYPLPECLIGPSPTLVVMDLPHSPL